MLLGALPPLVFVALIGRSRDAGEPVFFLLEAPRVAIEAEYQELNSVVALGKKHGRHQAEGCQPEDDVLW